MVFLQTMNGSAALLQIEARRDGCRDANPAMEANDDTHADGDLFQEIIANRKIERMIDGKRKEDARDFPLCGQWNLLLQ